MKRSMFCSVSALVILGLSVGPALASEAAGAAAKKHAGGHAKHAPHWSYTGKTSAEHWGDMEAGFATCKMGKLQSPIDIRGAAQADLPALGFNYASSATEVVNNGHTIQVTLSPGSSNGLKLPAGNFKLLQFHLHTPSEEKIDGQSFPMVAHMVHKSDEGQLAVVAVLFKLGRVNPTLARVLTSMPSTAESTPVPMPGLDPNALLPDSRAYYSFVGSLTTPPCSEGVLWHVMKQPVELSEGQLAAFKKLYPMNARPTQPLNGRSLKVSS